MSSLTLVTYNLWGYGAPSEYLKRRGIVRGAVPGSKAAHHGPADSVWTRRRARLIRTLEAADQDIVALQENARRPGEPDRSHARRLARASGMEVTEGTFYPMTDAEGHPFETGLALLTHLPVEEVTETPLPFDTPLRAGGIPSLLRVTLEFEDAPLHVWVVHFPTSTGELQLACAERVKETAEGTPLSEPLLFCGDLNAEPESPACRLLREAPPRFLDVLRVMHPGENGYTMPSHDPVARLDYVYLREGMPSLQISDAGTLGGEPDGDGFYGSDHLGVRATFTSE